MSACQSLPAAPEHRYYRLLASPASVEQHTLRLPGKLAVRPLRAEGLYSERSIVFSDEQQRQLQQYPYHYWLYPPGQLELRLERKGQVLRQQTCAAVEAVAGTTMDGFTAAMEVALNRIYDELLSDLAKIKLDWLKLLDVGRVAIRPTCFHDRFARAVNHARQSICS